MKFEVGFLCGACPELSEWAFGITVHCKKKNVEKPRNDLLYQPRMQICDARTTRRVDNPESGQLGERTTQQTNNPESGQPEERTTRRADNPSVVPTNALGGDGGRSSPANTLGGANHWCIPVDMWCERHSWLFRLGLTSLPRYIKGICNDSTWAVTALGLSLHLGRHCTWAVTALGPSVLGSHQSLGHAEA